MDITLVMHATHNTPLGLRSSVGQLLWRHVLAAVPLLRPPKTAVG